MKKGLLGLAFLSLAFTSSCSIKKPEVTITGYEFNSISLNNVKSTVHINVKNSNAVDLEVNKIEYNITINDIQDSANGSTNKKFKILGNTDKNKIDLPVTFNNNKAVPVLKSIMLSPEQINYTIIGSAYINTDMGEIKIPFSKEDTYKNAQFTDLLRDKFKSINLTDIFK